MDIEMIFKNSKVNFTLLENYGFKKDKHFYTYSTNFFNDKFKCLININKEGKIFSKVIDNLTNEEYVMINVGESQGEYVAKVRYEYQNILKDIREKCFEMEIYKSEFAKEVIKYIKEKYNTEPEFLWDDNAIFRHKDNKKWYAALLIVTKDKLGLKDEKKVEIIDLKNKPEIINNIVDNKKYFQGYHMNKKHWLTICLDGSLPLEKIYKLIDESYNLTK